MERVSSKKIKISKKMWVVICTILAIVVIAGGVFTYYAINASTDKIYEGVYVGDLHLGGKNVEEATELLKQKYPVSDMDIKLRCEGKEFTIYSSQIGLGADYEASAKEAAMLGKDGSVFEKISNMNRFKDEKQNIKLIFTCDTNLLTYLINENISEYIVDVTDYSVDVGDGCLIVTNGKDGRGVDSVKVMNLISDAYSDGIVDEVIDIEIETIKAESIDFEMFYAEYNREPQDAVLNRDGESYSIEPEVVGIKIDKDNAKKIIEDNRNNSESYEIPAEIIMPKVTAADLEAEFTDTVIASYCTDYSSSSANRKENIRLASSSINGKILNPGEVFSYNDIVGPRTEAAGYKMAHVYSGGKTVDGIGGGICQVSSTLYNAVVFADLEIVYRTNHSMPVSYVPLGRDATVSYGTIDFKFKNNKDTPVKIEVIADGSFVTVNIYGRQKYKKDISIETAITGTIKYTTTEIKDDTMYEGETKLEQEGANGTTVEAYKIVKENGEVVSKTLLCKSSYIPTEKIVRVGTKKKEVTDNDSNDSENNTNGSSDAEKNESNSETTDGTGDVPEHAQAEEQMTSDAQ